MREFLFTIAFNSGSDAVADTLTHHPDVSIRSLACHVTDESLWRVDHATGAIAGLRSFDETYLDETYLDETYLDETYLDETYLDETYLDPTYCPDCLANDCGSDLDTQVLDRTDDTRVFYVGYAIEMQRLR